MEKQQGFLTVRLSQELLESMRERAKQPTRSLNGEILVALQEHAIRQPHQQKREDKG